VKPTVRSEGNGCGTQLEDNRPRAEGASRKILNAGCAAMKVRILTLRFDSAEGRFIGVAFVELNEAMEVVDCAHHFLESDGLPYLLVIARCRDRMSAAGLRPAPHAGSAARRATVSDTTEPRTHGGSGASAHLNPEERRRFDALRTWRASRARADCVPTYIICRDRTLADAGRRAVGWNSTPGKAPE